MSVENFIDTNVFIYHLEQLDARKAAIADRLIEHGLASGTSCISFQVVQECINASIRKAQVPLTEHEMRRYLEHVLAPLFKVYPSLALYNSALDIRLRYQLSFYDSLIVASALEAGCGRLYTEDMQHGQRIHSLTIQNPFLQRS